MRSMDGDAQTDMFCEGVRGLKYRKLTEAENARIAELRKDAAFYRAAAAFAEAEIERIQWMPKQEAHDAFMATLPEIMESEIVF